MTGFDPILDFVELSKSLEYLHLQIHQLDKLSQNRYTEKQHLKFHHYLNADLMKYILVED